VTVEARSALAQALPFVPVPTQSQPPALSVAPAPAAPTVPVASLVASVHTAPIAARVVEHANVVAPQPAPTQSPSIGSALPPAQPASAAPEPSTQHNDPAVPVPPVVAAVSLVPKIAAVTPHHGEQSAHPRDSHSAITAPTPRVEAAERKHAAAEADGHAPKKARKEKKGEESDSDSDDSIPDIVNEAPESNDDD
jgi:hypothetical protein